MKRLFLVLIVFLSFFTIQAQEVIQMPNLDADFPDIDTVTYQEPYLLKVNIDTLYIINKEGLQSYKTCRESYEQLRAETEQIIQIKSVIENVDKEFGLLNENLDALEIKYERSLNENIKTNTFLKEKNLLVENELAVAKDNLNDAKQKIKAEKWNSKASKIMWGIGGALVGGTFVLLSQ